MTKTKAMRDTPTELSESEMERIITAVTGREFAFENDVLTLAEAKRAILTAMQAARSEIPGHSAGASTLGAGYDLAVATLRSWKGHGLSASTDERLEAAAHDLEASRDAVLWPDAETPEPSPPVQDDDAEWLQLLADRGDASGEQMLFAEPDRKRLNRIANRLGNQSLDR